MLSNRLREHRQVSEPDNAPVELLIIVVDVAPHHQALVPDARPGAPSEVVRGDEPIRIEEAVAVDGDPLISDLLNQDRGGTERTDGDVIAVRMLDPVGWVSRDDLDVAIHLLDTDH
jgi:hypothetical protein